MWQFRSHGQPAAEAFVPPPRPENTPRADSTLPSKLALTAGGDTVLPGHSVLPT